MPNLKVGATLPAAEVIGRKLGVTKQAAHKDLRRVLAEAGIRTRMTINPKGGTRVVVVEMPTNEDVDA